jgi:hypothetical protein
VKGGTSSTLIAYLSHTIEQISSITEQDYIGIISTYISMTEAEYRCSLCKKKYVRDKDRQLKHQERKGCFSEFASPILFYRGSPNTPMESASGILYHSCYARYYSQYWANIINLHTKFESGIMPFPGSLLEQPAKIVSVFDLIHNLKEESRIKKEETLAKYGSKRSQR